MCNIKIITRVAAISVSFLLATVSSQAYSFINVSTPTVKVTKPKVGVGCKKVKKCVKNRYGKRVCKTVKVCR